MGDLPSGGAIGAIDTGSAITKRRSFHGPNIDPDSAFKSASTIHGPASIDGDEDGASIKSVASAIKDGRHQSRVVLPPKSRL